ncbi:MAG: diguanylate cyclase [Rhodopila sp.]|jgi:diguanylate cyclase (GGDEF)-like protein/PAS domain S-box-containing protein
MFAIRAWGGCHLTSLSSGLAMTMVAVCLMVVGLEGWHTWDARTTAIAADKVETENLARSLAQHAHDLMQAVDIVVSGVRERVEVDGLSPNGLARLRRWMTKAMDTVPMIHGVFVYDAAGDWLANSVSAARPPLNNSDRDYFAYHRDHNEHRLFIGEPVHSKSDGSWIVTASRRMDAADGTFAGVVLVTMSIDALRRFYATFDVGKSGAITLLTSDGIVLAREPSGDGAVGTDLSHSQVFQVFLPKSPFGSFEAVYPVDGVTRVGSYRRVDGYRMVIVVAHGLDEVLREWRSDSLLHLAISGTMILALAILGIRFAGQLKRTQRLDRRYRLLADNSSDVIACVGLDGRRLYLSPSFSALTGWSVQDGLERPWQDFVHPDDRCSIRTTGSRLSARAGPVACRLRYLCKDGLHRWAEARVQLVDPADGSEAQFVANLRDITERKLAEDQVAALNKELALQAVTDGLTGLANRRRFDEGLTQEWRRAARERHSLSLLIIDVDRFKAYNDRYGHPRGDQCLCAVAAALAGCARRAGDIVARYGGEEFVMLLPRADATSALMLGESVRAAVQAIGLEHADNPPAGILTASVGVATMTPVPEGDEYRPADLVAAADAALYDAKHAGRNQVVCRTTVPLSVAPAPVLQG